MVDNFITENSTFVEKKLLLENLIDYLEDLNFLKNVATNEYELISSTINAFANVEKFCVKSAPKDPFQKYGPLFLGTFCTGVSQFFTLRYKIESDENKIRKMFREFQIAMERLSYTFIKLADRTKIHRLINQEQQETFLKEQDFIIRFVDEGGQDEYKEYAMVLGELYGSCSGIFKSYKPSAEDRIISNYSKDLVKDAKTEDDLEFITESFLTMSLQEGNALQDISLEKDEPSFQQIDLKTIFLYYLQENQEHFQQFTLKTSEKIVLCKCPDHPVPSSILRDLIYIVHNTILGRLNFEMFQVRMHLDYLQAFDLADKVMRKDSLNANIVQKEEVTRLKTSLIQACCENISIETEKYINSIISKCFCKHIFHIGIHHSLSIDNQDKLST